MVLLPREVGVGKRVFFTKKQIRPHGQSQGYPSMGIACKPEYVRLIFPVKCFKGERFVKWDDFPDSVELELFTDLVGGVESHNRLVVVTKMNGLDQPITDLVASR